MTPGFGMRLRAGLEALTTSARFAYGTLVLLQLKRVFGMWRVRDMPAGDTASYYAHGVDWYSNGTTNALWSPLYTIFYGSLMHFTDSAYTVTILHRLVIIFVVTVLFLAVLRRLLPHGIAWVIAAYWAILPNNFDLLYEVHLFAVIPTLVAFWVALHVPTPWTRGATLGIFLASAFLTRNEMIIAAALWGVVCLGWEMHETRNGTAAPVGRRLAAYGLPVLIAVALFAAVHARSSTQFPHAFVDLSRKHTLNVCQSYAFNYQQRHRDWPRSPWTECQDLMQRVFGMPEPSMLQAIRLNPRAMLGYFWWNARLVPDGVQVTLFNATAGNGQPDYIPRQTRSRYALALDVMTVAVLVIGGRYLWQGRREWWRRWGRERLGGWLAMLCTMAVMLVVMLTQRPRPSYLLNLYFFTTAAIGMCGFAIVDRWFGIKRLAVLVPLAALLLIAVVPSYFGPEYRNPDTSQGRPVMLRYTHLRPFQTRLVQPGAKFLSNGWASDMCEYIGLKRCMSVEFRDFVASKPRDVPFGTWLTHEQVTLFYVDEFVLADPAAQDFLAAPERMGWRMIAFQESDQARWRLFRPRTGSGN